MSRKQSSTALSPTTTSRGRWFESGWRISVLKNVIGPSRRLIAAKDWPQRKHFPTTMGQQLQVGAALQDQGLEIDRLPVQRAPQARKHPRIRRAEFTASGRFLLGWSRKILTGNSRTPREILEMATEVSDQAFHSAQSLYLKLLGAFPDYAADFKAKLQSWQEAISPSSEFVPLITDYTLGIAC